MSYILDALKQSDQQRKCVEELNIEVPAVADLEQEKITAHRYWYLAAALVLGVLFIGFYTLENQPVSAEKKQTEAPVTEISMPASDGASVNEIDKQQLYGVTISVDEPVVSTPDRTPRSQLKQSSALRSDGDETVTITAVAPSSQSDDVNQTDVLESTRDRNTQLASVAPVKPVATVTAPENEAIYWRQLPLAIQRSLPELNFSVHLYTSQPTTRMVKVNGRVLREGDQITTSLTLDQITREGVILVYKGYRFRMKPV